MLKTKRVQVVSETNQHRHTGNEIETVPVADLNSKILDTPPQIGPFFFHIMQFSGKFGRIKGWRPPLGLSPTFGKSWIRPWVRTVNRWKNQIVRR